jgi:phytanoyl-CoA dioxygenase PhyH
VKLFGIKRIVSEEQIRFYRDQGFVLIPGLVRASIVQRARHMLSEQIPAGHTGAWHQVVKTPALLKCVTTGVCETAGQLEAIGSRLKRATSIYTIAVCPETGVWQWPAPHIDHAIREHRFRTFPPPFRIGCLIYLTDVLSHSGATIVWPQSHRQLAALAATNAEKYEFLSALNESITEVPLNNPVEITAGAGDVLFYNRLCAHSGSKNIGQNCRLAVNHKW